MKRMIVLCLTLLLAICLMACANTTDDANVPDDGGSSADSQGSQNADEQIVIRIGHIATENLPEHLAAVKFKEYLEEKSDGRLSVEIFPNGALGGDRQLTEAVSLGTLDITFCTTSILTAYDERFGILDLPFIWTDAEQGFAAVDGELGAYLDAILPEYGIHNLGYMLNGVRHMLNNEKPINEPADLKGLKMRVIESPVYIDMFTLLGANPTPMSFSEVYTSLQQGVINGFECNASFVYEMNFYDVQKYYSLTGHTISFLGAIMNADKYNSLPDDLKALVDEAARTYLVDWQREYTLSEDETLFDKLRECGMKINEITPENHAKFVEAVSPMYENYEGQWGSEVFDLLRKYQAE